MFVHHYPTVLVLSVIVMAGFGAGASIGIVHDFVKQNRIAPLVELLQMLALLGIPNLVAAFSFVKVWRLPPDFVLLGHRKIVWQILLSISYALGLGGSLVMFL